MPETAVKKSVFCLLLCFFLFVSCADQVKKDSESLKTDATAVAEVNRVNNLLKNGLYLSQNDIDSLNKIREKYPNAPLARNVLLSALIKREDWQPAADVIGQIPESARTDEDKTNLAKIFIKLGRYEDALDTVNPLLDKKPADAELVSLASTALFYLGRYDESAALLDKIWTEIVGAKRIDEITLRGIIYFYQKNYDKAVETLNKSLEINAENIPALNALARIYTAKGETAKAEDLTAKVQQILGKMSAESRRKTKFVEDAKKLDEAFKANRFEEVIQIARAMLSEADAENKYALYQYLANAYQSLGKTKEAQEAFAEAEKVKSKK